MIKQRKINPLIKIINSSLIDLPTPINISSWWNFGSLLSLCLITQITSGLFLAIHYTRDISIAFRRVIYIVREVEYGWILRRIHANGASIFFICLYCHVGRGIYFSSFKLKETWTIGVIILFLIMATAFIGYVLPWGQISFWGATVITNLLSAVPYLGEYTVQWVWGGFAVDNATLTRFFSVHFILPFITIGIIGIHLLFLHQTGSNNPLGISSSGEKIQFHPFFSRKDLRGFILIRIALTIIIIIYPNLLGDTENFIPANPLVTPTHIQPEWYFLFAYAILRSIPNKLGGVIALIISISIILTLPIKNNKIIRIAFKPINKIIFLIIVNTIILLTWIGACPVERPYILCGQVLTIIYFLYFTSEPLISQNWEKILL